MLCNGRQPFPRNPPRNTSRRSLNRSVWSPWLLCNGKEAFSTKPTKKHVQKKSKPERFETADSPALRDHQTTSKRSPPRDTSKRSLNQCVLNPSPFTNVDGVPKNLGLKLPRSNSSESSCPVWSSNVCRNLTGIFDAWREWEIGADLGSRHKEWATLYELSVS